MKCLSGGQIVGISVILVITVSFILTAIYGAVTGNKSTHHSAVACAANFTATHDWLRNPDQLRRSPVAPTAPHGIKPAEALIAAG